MLRTIASGRLVQSTLVRESRRIITSFSKKSVCTMPIKSLSLMTTTTTTTSYFARFQSTTAMEEKSIEHSPEADFFAPIAERNYEFFTNVEFTEEGVAIIRFDCPKKVNSISFALSEEAKKLWKNQIENNSEVKAVVFSSAKPDMFIAGADIFDIKRIENKKDLVGLIEEGMNFFMHMRKKKVPLVCAINGPALGGGLEWAMWCDYRVCSDSPKTKVRNTIDTRQFCVFLKSADFIDTYTHSNRFFFLDIQNFNVFPKMYTNL